MSPEEPDIIRTSIVGSLLPRLSRTHERRRIAVFSGPPGIGKSTAIEAFRWPRSETVAVVSVPPGPRSGVKPTAALQLLHEAIYTAADHLSRVTIPTGYVMLRGRTHELIAEWAGLRDGHLYGMRAGRAVTPDLAETPCLTVVFDEAQNLAREAIEQLRFVNDLRGGYSPIPIGLVFVGNNEFALKSNARGESVLSAAVSDRALYTDTLRYDDVSDDDLSLYFEASGVEDEGAVRVLVSYFSATRSDRSFRRAADLLDSLKERTKDGQVTASIARHVLGL